MDPIERGLQQEIPLKEAADFFLKMKYGSHPEEKMASRDIAVVRGRIKHANAMMGPAGAGGMAPPSPASMPVATPPPLPATAKGMNVTSIGAMAKMAVSPEWVAQHAASGVATAAPSKVNNFMGSMKNMQLRAAGNTRPGLTSDRMLKNTSAGYRAGMAVGGAPPDSPHLLGKMAARLRKLAFEPAASMTPNPGEEKSVTTEDMSTGSIMDPVDMRQYLASEEEGQAAEEENHAAFLRERLQQVMQELQGAKDMAMTAQTTAQTLQQAQAQHQQELTAAQQQSQLATAAAMENVTQAHELALKATSDALQAKDDAINTHQMAAQMRMAYQDMRGAIMDAVAQDAAAPIGEAIKAKGMESQTVPPGTEPAGQNGEGADPGAEGAPKEGAPGDTPSPNNVNKDSQPQEQAGGEGTPSAAAGPASPPPDSGGEHKNQANAEGGGASGGLFDGKDPKPVLQVGTQAQPGVGGSAKQAASPWNQVFQSAMGHLKQNAPYAAAGGALGAALPFVESRVGHEGLREKVKGLESSGEKSFGHTMELAKSKIQLALGEIAEKNPKASMAIGGLVGASAGMALGPQIMEGFKALPGRFSGKSKGGNIDWEGGQ